MLFSTMLKSRIKSEQSIMKALVFSAIVATVLWGCATPTSPEGMHTREIDKSWENSCEFLGSSETSSAVKFGANANRETVINNIKNLTAEKGGNAYVVNDLDDDGLGHYSAKFEIFRCPETKYVLPNKYEALEKIKDLLDKGVLTQEEYEQEKEKILSSYE